MANDQSNLRDNECESVQFSWIGEYSKINRILNYKSCSVNGEVLSLGDSVTVKMDDDKPVAVGHIIELFEKLDNDPHRAKIDWYFRHDDLPQKCKQLSGTKHDQELFSPFEKYIEEIDAETILQKCTVEMINTNIDEVNLDLFKVICFFKRYQFSHKGLQPFQNYPENCMKLENANLQNTPKLLKTTEQNSHITPENTMFNWLGDERKRNRRSYYNRCSVNGEIIDVGNTVTVRKEEGDLSVGTVVEMFEDCSSDPYRVIINWYYRWEELPLKTKQLTDTRLDYELFVPNKPYTQEIDAETMRKKSAPVTLCKDKESAELFNKDGIFFKRFEFGIDIGLKLLNDCSEKPLQKIKSNMLPGKNDASTKKASVTKKLPTEMTSIPSLKRKETSRKSKQIPKKTIKSPAGNLKKQYGVNDVLEMIDEDNSEMSDSSSLSVMSCSTTDSSQLPRDNDVAGTSMNEIKNITSKYKVLKPNSKKSGEDIFDFHSDDEYENNKQSECRIARVQTKVKYNNKINRIVEDDTSSDDEVIFSGNESIETNSGDTSDEEVTVKKKIKSQKPLRKSSASVTGRLASNNISSIPQKSQLMSPGIAVRTKPRISVTNPLQFARQRLHVSAVPDSLPCRDQEFADIFCFIQDHIDGKTGGCMYISGVPGTGKTATVHEVIRHLQSAPSDGYGSQFRFIEINGMKLTDPNQTYPALLKLLTGQKASTDHAANVLEKMFSEDEPEKEHIVLLVDELDLLWTRKQNVLYNLFDWPSRRYSKLIILAVANTMDLPERIMMNRVSSRLGLTRITFQPYTFRQLQEIVISRMQERNVFEDDALQLVARKVAAVSGDARRCLDICRRAVEIAESIPNDPKLKKGPRKNSALDKELVSMQHVEQALQEMFSSPTVKALRSLSSYEAMFMKALISEFRRTGLEEALFFEVYNQFRSHCTLEGGVEPLNASSCFTMCNGLGNSRLLLLETATDIYQRIRMNVSQDDVLFAFKMKN